MALKFLNKKGWHTGSLRNIENVWKAEQKHDAEQKKLEELRKQIQEERERSEFRLLQEQAGLVPKQERLEFLYDSGLAVGKGSSDGFKALEALPKCDNETTTSTSAKQESVPGALFEEKRQSANDAWRKLHSDPLLMIRQREQEALARVKNNPIQMAMIRKSVEARKHKEKTSNKSELQKGQHQHKSRHQKHSSSKHRSKSENVSSEGDDRWKPRNQMSSKFDKHEGQADESSEVGIQNKKQHYEYMEHPPSGLSGLKSGKTEDKKISKREKCAADGRAESPDAAKKKENESFRRASLAPPLHESHRKHRNIARLSEKERATRLREMLVDAELHEEQRWKRLRQAEEDDAREAMQAGTSRGRNFLDAAQKSIYGADKGGSSTIEESVRRRTHYLQGKSDVGEGNAFRR